MNFSFPYLWRDRNRKRNADEEPERHRQGQRLQKRGSFHPDQMQIYGKSIKIEHKQHTRSIEEKKNHDGNTGMLTSLMATYACVAVCRQDEE